MCPNPGLRLPTALASLAEGGVVLWPALSRLPGCLAPAFVFSELSTADSPRPPPLGSRTVFVGAVVVSDCCYPALVFLVLSPVSKWVVGLVLVLRLSAPPLLSSRHAVALIP